jgi:hypothetical protein
MSITTKKVILNPMRPVVKGPDERKNTITNNQLTNEQIASYKADAESVLKEASEYSEERAAAKAIAELATEVQALRVSNTANFERVLELENELETAYAKLKNHRTLNPANLINKFYERYPVASFKSDIERSEALGYYMAGAEIQCFGEFIKYQDLCGDE